MNTILQNIAIETQINNKDCNNQTILTIFMK